jgi:hypothetical protein
VGGSRVALNPVHNSVKRIKSTQQWSTAYNKVANVPVLLVTETNWRRPLRLLKKKVERGVNEPGFLAKDVEVSIEFRFANLFSYPRVRTDGENFILNFKMD